MIDAETQSTLMEFLPGDVILEYFMTFVDLAETPILLFLQCFRTQKALIINCQFNGFFYELNYFY